MAGIEPAASTLARRDRSLAVTPGGQASAKPLRPAVMMLTLWRCQKPGLCERLAGTAGVEPGFGRFWRLAGSSPGKRKPPRGAFPGAVTGKCLVALTRQPFRRSGQPQAARSGSCTRLVSASAMSSYVHGRSSRGRGQLYLPAHYETGASSRTVRTPRARPDARTLG